LCRFGIGHQDAAQRVAGWFDGVDVDHQSAELVVEHLRFDAGDGAGLDDLVQPGAQQAVAPGARIERQAQGQYRDEGGEGGDRKQQAVEPDAGRMQGDDLAVRREAAEGDEDGQQQCHRHGHFEERRHDVRENLENLPQWNAAVDDHLDQLEDANDQQDGREHGQTEQKRDDQLTQQVAVENLHCAEDGSEHQA
jgi:hypothetical protein